MRNNPALISLSFVPLIFRYFRLIILSKAPSSIWNNTFCYILFTQLLLASFNSSLFLRFNRSRFTFIPSNVVLFNLRSSFHPMSRCSKFGKSFQKSLPLAVGISRIKLPAIVKKRSLPRPEKHSALIFSIRFTRKSSY